MKHYEHCMKLIKLPIFNARPSHIINLKLAARYMLTKETSKLFYMNRNIKIMKPSANMAAFVLFCCLYLN